jgi:recombination protein RecA
MADKDKLKKLKESIDSINKNNGENTVMLLSEKKKTEVDAISTGSIGLDIALGIGGLPRGRIVEIYGPESSGKTTLAIHVIAEAQKKGGICAFIDAEHAFDSEYAKKLGVDIDNLVINQPDWGEQGLEVAEKLISSGSIDVCVVDSVSALTPKKEIEGEMGDQNMGLQARMMSQAMRKLNATAHKNGVCLIFLNQLREKIGVMFGSPEVTTGGNALKFYASVRIDMRRSTTTENLILDANKEAIGHLVRIKVVKNKVAAPFKKAELDLIYGVGFDSIGEIVEIASKLGVIKKWGKTITLLDNGAGGETKYDIEEFKTYLRDNEDFLYSITKSIKEKI